MSTAAPRGPAYLSLARYVGLALLLAAGLQLRLTVGDEWHVPAGDGIGYHQLAHELRRAGRYAFGPPPQPLVWSREPGWPALLALVDPGEPNDIEVVLVRGVRLNAVLDTLTGLFTYLIVVEAGLPALGAWLALLFALGCPLLLLDACFLLRETLSTTLSTLALYLAVRGLRRRSAPSLIAGAGVVGLTMLVRFDAILLGVAFLVPWWRLPGPLLSLGPRTRGRVAALALVALALPVLPWAVRNQVRFGAPHLAGSTWQDPSGRELPTGERWWVRTWVDKVRFEGTGAAWLNLRLVFRQPVTERDVPADAASSPEERRELMAIFARYNREGLSPEVDAAFRELAWRRVREHPARILLWLPVKRAALWLWSFPPKEEQPMRSATLHQPERRDLFERSSRLFAILGGIGLLACLLGGFQHFAVVAVLTLAVRALVMSIAGPDGGYQRYLAPAYPALLAVGAAGPALVLAWPLRRLGRLRRRGGSGSASGGPA